VLSSTQRDACHVAQNGAEGTGEEGSGHEKPVAGNGRRRPRRCVSQYPSAHSAGRAMRVRNRKYASLCVSSAPVCVGVVALRGQLRLPQSSGGHNSSVQRNSRSVLPPAGAYGAHDYPTSTGVEMPLEKGKGRQRVCERGAERYQGTSEGRCRCRRGSNLARPPMPRPLSNNGTVTIHTEIAQNPQCKQRLGCRNGR